MDDRPVVWDDANRRHLGEEHPERGVSLTDVEEVLADPDRLESYLAQRGAHAVVGRTLAGRWLVVVWIDRSEGRYPIHARPASRRIIRRVTK
jgi:uncharacterized DUF497 family protein